MHRLRLPVALCACAVLALPAAAGARPATRSFGATYPVASVLCARVANGHAPKHLAGSVPAVEAACTTLKTSFTNAQNAYTTTVAPLRQQAVTAVAALRATCNAARAAHNLTPCQAARTQTRTLLSSLRAQVRGAATSYHTAVDAARRTFWSTIHALRGGAALPADTKVGPGPQTTLPSNSSLLKA